MTDRIVILKAYPYCHSERSEESQSVITEILRSAQNDNPRFFTEFRMTGTEFRMTGTEFRMTCGGSEVYNSHFSLPSIPSMVQSSVSGFFFKILPDDGEKTLNAH
jgi:hypothetical protein